MAWSQGNAAAVCRRAYWQQHVCVMNGKTLHSPGYAGQHCTPLQYCMAGPPFNMDLIDAATSLPERCRRTVFSPKTDPAGSVRPSTSFAQTEVSFLVIKQ